MEWLAIVATLAVGGMALAAIRLAARAEAASREAPGPHRHMITFTSGDFIELLRGGQVLLHAPWGNDSHSVLLTCGEDFAVFAAMAAEIVEVE